MSFMQIAYGILLLEAIEILAKLALPIGAALLVYRAVGPRRGGLLVDVLLGAIVALSAAVLSAIWYVENL
jgi:hypothetical protein